MLQCVAVPSLKACLFFSDLSVISDLGSLDQIDGNDPQEQGLSVGGFSPRKNGRKKERKKTIPSGVVTPASLEYPLSGFNENSTFKDLHGIPCISCIKIDDALHCSPSPFESVMSCPYEYVMYHMNEPGHIHRIKRIDDAFVPEKMRLEMVIGMEIGILNGH